MKNIVHLTPPLHEIGRTNPYTRSLLDAECRNTITRENEVICIEDLV